MYWEEEDDLVKHEWGIITTIIGTTTKKIVALIFVFWERLRYSASSRGFFLCPSIKFFTRII